MQMLGLSDAFINLSKALQEQGAIGIRTHAYGSVLLRKAFHFDRVKSLWRELDGCRASFLRSEVIFSRLFFKSLFKLCPLKSLARLQRGEFNSSDAERGLSSFRHQGAFKEFFFEGFNYKNYIEAHLELKTLKVWRPTCL